MNFKEFRELNKKAIELHKQKSRLNFGDDYQELKEISTEYNSITLQLEKYNSLFNITLADFIVYLNEYYQNLNINLQLDVTNISFNTINSQDFAENPEEIRTYNIEYALKYGTTNIPVTIAKSSIVSNNPNAFPSKQEVKENALQLSSLLNTKFNLISNEQMHITSYKNTLPTRNELLFDIADAMDFVALKNIQAKAQVRKEELNAKLAEIKQETQLLKKNSIDLDYLCRR